MIGRIQFHLSLTLITATAGAGVRGEASCMA